MLQGFGRMTEVVKNLIIINVLVFVLMQLVDPRLTNMGMLHYWENPDFMPIQLVTAFFMHGDFWHLLFNMFVLFFLGGAVEDGLGPKRFLFLYLAAGFGANILETVFNHLQVHQLMAEMTPQQVAYVQGTMETNIDNVTGTTIEMGRLWYKRALGASGATYGVMFAFAALYPDRELRLLIPPITVKAVYLVLFLAMFQFIQEVGRYNTGIGHFVHLSGAVIALGLITWWRKRGASF
jgi:membrane associated rhomboid family serine protease